MARTARKGLKLEGAPGKGFDIRSRAMAETAVVTLLDPMDATKELDAHITIASPNSPEARAAREAFPIRVADGKIDMPDAEFEAVSLEHAIAITKDWDLTDGGKPLPCTPGTVRWLYTAPEWRWIAGQIRNKQLSMASFFPDARPS